MIYKDRAWCPIVECDDHTCDRNQHSIPKDNPLYVVTSPFHETCAYYNNEIKKGESDV